jgi:hypothetical protein
VLGLLQLLQLLPRTLAPEQAADRQLTDSQQAANRQPTCSYQQAANRQLMGRQQVVNVQLTCS